MFVRKGLTLEREKAMGDVEDTDMSILCLISRPF